MNTTGILQYVLSAVIGFASAVVPVLINNREKTKRKLSDSNTATEGIYAQQLPKLLDNIQTLSAKNMEVTNELIMEEHRYSNMSNKYDNLKEDLDDLRKENEQLRKEIVRLNKIIVSPK